MRIARFAPSISLLLLLEQLAHVNDAEVYADGTMDQVIDHGVGLHTVAESAAPLRRRVLRAQHGRLGRVTSLDELEREGYVDVCRLRPDCRQHRSSYARLRPCSSAGIVPLVVACLIAAVPLPALRHRFHQPFHTVSPSSGPAKRNCPDIHTDNLGGYHKLVILL